MILVGGGGTVKFLAVRRCTIITTIASSDGLGDRISGHAAGKAIKSCSCGVLESRFPVVFVPQPVQEHEEHAPPDAPTDGTTGTTSPVRS